ncbi:MAG: hypothetical protein BYD32DRAFT_268201 [Podila humilis]|nr:MAG: hypothetical protein BYD32DRAFT_268201 [Podila humilis]
MDIWCACPYPTGEATLELSGGDWHVHMGLWWWRIVLWRGVASACPESEESPRYYTPCSWMSMNTATSSLLLSAMAILIDVQLHLKITRFRVYFLCDRTLGCHECDFDLMWRTEERVRENRRERRERRERKNRSTEQRDKGKERDCPFHRHPIPSLSTLHLSHPSLPSPPSRQSIPSSINTCIPSFSSSPSSSPSFIIHYGSLASPLIHSH